MRELRFGFASKLYYENIHRKLPGQLDLIDAWFPSLIVEEVPSDGETKTDAEYDDRCFHIRAVKYHGSYYAGEGRRVSQITGRLSGTAKGNQEKERKTASLIQKHLAEQMVTDLKILPRLQETVLQRIEQLDGEQREHFYGSLFSYIDAMITERESKTEYDLLNELFPMDREVFEGILYNTSYQLAKLTDQAIANGYLWLLLGGLLRNEAGRILRLYDSSFIPIRRQSSDDGTIRDKLYYLLRPDRYESFYEGDDLDMRYPGIEWYCDRCESHLNSQDGFTDRNPVWVCKECGYENRIDASLIYDNEEDYHNQTRPMREEAIERAIRERKAAIKK